MRPKHRSRSGGGGWREVMKRFILASKSKRRAEILKSCGIRHKVFVTNAKEASHNRIHSAKLVVENAKRKALAAAGCYEKGLVLGVDTVVLFKGRNIGKPRNEAHARRMLKAFSGQKIAVYSGLYLIDKPGNRFACGFEKTGLKVKKIQNKDIEKYFLKLGPYGRAGGFSIEGAGAIIFDDIKGSYFNVLGLPMGKLSGLFEKLGYDILNFMEG